MKLEGRPEGAIAPCGRVRGSYLHGMFGSDAFRAAFLRSLGAESHTEYDETVETTLDKLAGHLEEHLDLDLLLSLSAPVSEMEKA